MSPSFSAADFGEPDLRVAGFQLWIHGRQFPDATDRDDGNWLRVTAHCGASGASVWAQGSILQAQDILGFREQCGSLSRGEASEARLLPLEPELCITLTKADRLGHVLAKVEITPNNLTQSHAMTFEIDQSYLPGIIDGCNRILEEYPVRGASSPRQ